MLMASDAPMATQHYKISYNGLGGQNRAKTIEWGSGGVSGG